MGIGTMAVCLWTVLRHITNGVNFDVVGQIGLADQWTRGLHSGAQLGVTNYVWKMPLYVIVNALDFISPMNRLLLLALICNVMTFLLLFVLFEKILKLYAVKDRTWLYLGMLWLASITGSVFWADYANSRNLETVGGVLFLYLGLRFLKYRQARTALLLTLTGSMVFFADSLELYVFGVGICTYLFVHWLLLRTRENALNLCSVVGLTGLAFIGSKLLSLALARLLSVQYLSVPHQPINLDASTLTATAHGLLNSTLDVLGANFIKRPYAANTFREIVGFITLLALVVVFARNWSRIRAKTAVQVGLMVLVINYAVYVASGQVLVWATSRYLILIPLVLVLIIAISGDAFTRKFERRTQISLFALSLISIFMLVGGLVTQWPVAHSKDKHIYTTLAFLQSNGFKYALSSREVGVTTTYFAEGQSMVLPMLCTDDHRLIATDLFYDRAPFERLQNQTAPIAIIVPEAGITAGRRSCSTADVLAQFGNPDRQQIIPGVGDALVYKPARITSTVPIPFSD